MHALRTITTLWLLCSLGCAVGQDLETPPARIPNSVPYRWFVGVDATKHLNAIPYPGVYPEVLVKYNVNRTNWMAVTGAVGYARMRMRGDTIYRNMVAYRAEGWYAKLGFEAGRLTSGEMGISFVTQAVLSNFSDQGGFTFDNDYFGGATIPFRRANNWAFGGEAGLNMYWIIHPRFLMAFQARASLVMLSSEPRGDRSLPVFYTPGFGRSGNGYLAAGVGFQFFYVFGGKNEE
ncbi:MAG: hypothetical protein MUD08_02190 [Cytophagales bacterium]|nr:hypothetical protein [Cytophagales bacterium]